MLHLMIVTNSAPSDTHPDTSKFLLLLQVHHLPRGLLRSTFFFITPSLDETVVWDGWDG
jgi:hypothetical protein